MKRLLLCAVALLSWSATLGNGDPTDRISALTASANPAPLTITDVQLISEHLWIRPGYYTQVRVRYVLLNNSDKDYNDIDYGFPVDYMGGGERYVNSPLQSDYYSESRFLYGWHDDYIRDIAFRADGAPLEWTMSKETTLFAQPEPTRDEYPDEGEYNGAMSEWMWEVVSRRWFYTRFSIGAGESLTLEVDYSVRNSRTRSSTHDGGSIFNDGNSSFLYDLSPAAHWGDGKVRDLFVEIDTRDITTVKENWSERDGVSGLPFRQEGDVLKYDAANFAFEGSQPIRFEYLLRREIDPASVFRHRIPRHLYNIQATGTSPKYPVENLSDADLSTAWVTAPDGKGQKITITFKEPTEFTDIFIAGGYLKSPDTFSQNSRPEKVSVKFTGQSEEWNEQGHLSGKMSDSELSGTIRFQSDLAALPFWANIGLLTGSYRPDQYDLRRFWVSKIEITIDEIHPGSKYTDLCISEIILIDMPAEKYP